MKKSECTWYDRKRHFGLPISFTKYYIHEDRFFNETGFFTSVFQRKGRIKKFVKLNILIEGIGCAEKH